MTTKIMQHVLQTALSSGFSATEGFHSDKPNKVDPSFNGMEAVLPQYFVPQTSTRITLKGKKSDVQIPWMSIGAWPWGDKATWHWDPKEREGLNEAWKYLVDNNITYIDTAQAYGSGESEVICGELVKDMPRDKFIMQTKYYVVPDNFKNIFTPASAPYKMLKESLERMKLDYMDVYMVHGHIHAGSIKQVAKSLADCVDEGLCKVVAVANYSVEDMLQMKEELAKYDIPLELNQCEYHVMRRLPETEGMLRTCREKGIQFQSYSSLAQGRLTGKWTPDNEPPKTYRFSSYPIKEIQHTLDVVKRIAEKRGVSMAAVALNYNISKGVNPVVGVRNLEQAKSNLQAFGWRLTDEEIREMDSVSIEGKHTKLWQQG
ncbi:Aldo/keto reductase [Aureobasidium pullulans]|nr:Aldo/keto reductase [Aureobasidium pullulans]TIA04693.1 Aldo/keto reductase [Aureobasidium pullulans]